MVFYKTLTLTVFQGKSYAKQHENHFKQSAFKEIEKKNLMEQKVSKLKKLPFLKKNHKFQNAVIFRR